MKKRLLLITLMVALFVCLFVLSVSAEGVPANGRLGTNTIVDGIALPSVIDVESQIQMDDGLIYPSFYFFKDQTTTAYDFSRVTKADGTNYTIDNIVKMEIPHGITKMDNLGYRDKNKTTLTHVRIPNTITSHNWNGGFRTTKSLVSVEFEEGYSYKIFGSMFHSCPVANFVIPEGVTEIESESMNSMGIVNLVIPDNVEIIGSNPFGGNPLESVTISENSKLRSIGYRAFAGISTLTSTIYLPSSLETLGEGVFSSSYNIAGFENLENTKLTAIPAQTFYECRADSFTSLKLPTKVTSIGKNAFKGAYKLVSITGLENVETIGESAFNGCTALESVDLTNKITSLSNSTFEGCKALKFVNTENVTSFGTKCFLGCSSLDGIVINSAVTTIPENFCRDCTSLTSIVIPASVTTINGYAFSGCSNLASVTNYAEGITTLNAYVFSDCPMTEFNMPDSLTSIGNSCFKNAQFTEIDIPNTVTTIGDAAFQNCSRLTSLKLPRGLSIIQHDTLHGCSSLTELTVPVGCTVYGQYSFNQNGSNMTVTYTGKEGDDGYNSLKSYLTQATYVFANHCDVYYDKNHDATMAYTFTSYVESSCMQGTCTRCGEIAKGETFDPIIEFLGYAIKMDSTSVTVGYSLDKEALAKYEAEGNTFNYGVVGYIPTAEEGTSYAPLQVGENGVEAVNKQYI